MNHWLAVLARNHELLRRAIAAVAAPGNTPTHVPPNAGLFEI